MKRYRIKEIFNSRIENMVDSSVFPTEAYKMMKGDYEAAIYAGPTYIRTVYCKFKYRQIVNSIQYIMHIF